MKQLLLTDEEELIVRAALDSYRPKDEDEQDTVLNLLSTLSAAKRMAFIPKAEEQTEPVPEKQQAQADPLKAPSLPMEVRCRYQTIRFTSAVGTSMDQFHREVDRLLAEGWEVGGPRTDTKLSNAVYLHHQTFSKVEKEA